MALEEIRAWIMLVVSIVAYGAYVFVVARRADGVPVAEIPYEKALLWSIGGAIVAAIVLHILAAIVTGRGDERPDQRDREIGRFGEHVGQSFVVIGGVAALILAMLEVEHFWIANAVYLAFVLSALLGSVAKIFASRKGFHPW